MYSVLFLLQHIKAESPLRKLPWAWPFCTCLLKRSPEESPHRPSEFSFTLQSFSFSCLQRIKAESTGQSLVLLDEVGGGTDPTEGAALGMALLQSFAERKPGGSLLTMATTHHGELKTLKYSDPRFENACVEFDEERLAPTFRLLWGIPGELIGSRRSPA